MTTFSHPSNTVLYPTSLIGVQCMLEALTPNRGEKERKKERKLVDKVR